MGQIYKCSRGFLIERQEDGNYTPFFVKVRVQDVIDDNGNMAFPSGGSGEGGGGGTSGGSVVVKQVDDWTVTMLTSSYFMATKVFPVESITFTKNPTNDTELYGNITLPYQVAADHYLSVDIGVSGANDNIATATVSFEPLKTGSKITGLRLSIRNLIYTFPNDWTRDITYENSKLYVRVSGQT